MVRPKRIPKACDSSRRSKRVRRPPEKLLDYKVPETINFKCVRVGANYIPKPTPPAARRRRPGTPVLRTPAKRPPVQTARLRRSVFGCKYPVKNILTHTVTKSGTTKFRIAWAKPYEGRMTLEPIECLRESPLLIKKYQMREEVKFRRRLRSSGVDDSSVPFQFPKIKTCISNKMKHPAESYIPHGSEKVLRILEEIVVPNNGVHLWDVQFRGFDCSHLVNKQRIVYYFPLNACLFVNECITYELRGCE
jgi:hypothetical protein